MIPLTIGSSTANPPCPELFNDFVKRDEMFDAEDFEALFDFSFPAECFRYVPVQFGLGAICHFLRIKPRLSFQTVCIRSSKIGLKCGVRCLIS